MKRICSLVGIVLLPLASGAAVTMDLVTVGDPVNAPDPLNTNSVPGIGSVAYTYQIGKFEVFNSQYVDFLNAVADTDTYGLYNANMSSHAQGGIVQSGSSGSYTYSAKSGYENMPVTFVSFYDAVRFVNWMENGQPTGAQGANTTETGSYTLFTSGSSTTNVSARVANATWVIPTENEWYKAAYYDPTASGTTNYWLYPMQTDSVPYSDQPPGTSSPDASRAGNFFNNDGSANGYNDGFAKTGSTSFNSATNYLTAVGSYTLADSYYGTFDQGGNVVEWTQTSQDSQHLVAQAGTWGDAESRLNSSFRGGAVPSEENQSTGFRVALIPEPGAFVAMALAGLAACGWRRRRRSGVPSSNPTTVAALALVLHFIPAPSQALVMSTVTVSNANNPADSTGYGSVGYNYVIGKFEVQNSEYAEFLNAVAATDTYGLYNASMGAEARGGIVQSGSSGNYTYSVKANMGDKPVNFVSYYDAVRFANWMANGQPMGGQTNGVTETGSYTLTGAASVGARNANATWVIPTENEWYKAAYYDPSASGPSDDYWLYPVRSDSVPLHTVIDSAGNVVADPGTAANYGLASDWNGQDGNVTSYAYNSASYYGTYDQGGNVGEWNEAIIGSNRGLRGGDWSGDESYLRSSVRYSGPPTGYGPGIGFRLAVIPEPGSVAAIALAALAISMWRPRRRGGPNRDRGRGVDRGRWANERR